MEKKFLFSFSFRRRTKATTFAGTAAAVTAVTAAKLTADHRRRSRTKSSLDFDLESRADYIDYDYVDDDYHDDYHDYHLYEGEIFRDVDYLERPKIIRNPRDHRHFPGIVPAGIGGITPNLYRFIKGHVNKLSLYVQGPPPPNPHPVRHHLHRPPHLDYAYHDYGP